MRSRWVLLFVVMHIAGFGSAVRAQTLDQQGCPAPDPDLSISRCTAMIQSDHETQQNLARAFSSRGLAYARKGQYDHAIEDFDQAIRLNPNDAVAFSNRGAAYARRGQPDRAIEDYDQAIRLNPDYATAFYNRGFVKRAKGDFAGGDDDIAKAKQLNPNVGN